MNINLTETKPTTEGYHIVTDRHGDPMIVYYDHEGDVISDGGYIYKVSDFKHWSTMLTINTDRDRCIQA